MSRGYRCACGYEFGQSVEKALALLADQRTNARIVLGLLVLAGLAMLGVCVFLGLQRIIVVPALAFAALAPPAVRVAHKLAITRASIKQLEQRKLPEARLLKG